MSNEVYDMSRPMRNIRVLDKGKRGKLYWTILSMGSHPCCYIGLPKGHKYYGIGYDELSVDCHGGLTYAAKDLHQNPIDIDLWWIGWDFAHAGDFIAQPPELLKQFPEMADIHTKDHKWTIDELRAEIKHVLDQVVRPKKVRRDRYG